MKIIDCEQGSVEWMQARAAIPTASEFDALISPLGEIRKGKMPATYLAKFVKGVEKHGIASGATTSAKLVRKFLTGDVLIKLLG